jgi:hypothetical protein
MRDAGSGGVLERMHPGRGFTFGLLLFTIALGIPLVAARVHGASVAYGLFLGAGAGGVSAANGVVWTEYFGVSAIGALKGIVSAVRNAATAGGAVGVALLAGGDGAYGRALAAGAALALVGTVVSLLLPRPATAAERPCRS